MERIVDAARFVRRLGVIARRDELWAQFKIIAAQHGFTFLTVLKAPQGEPVSLIHTNAPPDVLAAFDGGPYKGDDHPLLLRALSQIEPFSREEVRATDLTAQQTDMLSCGRETLGVTNGWTFPITKDGVREGIVILAGQEPDMSPVLRSMLHLLAHLAFQKSETLDDSGGKGESRTLTARELECLRWVAVGKTDSEIAVILSIKPRTARFHIENAKRKMGVATRVQAVAEAMRLQTIAA
jgi:DNA-binding CsgD family transcriptional regulator